jgi:hypothetical protein
VYAVHPERLLSQFQEWRRVDMQPAKLATTGSCFPVNIDRQSRINIFFFLTKLDYAGLGLSGIRCFQPRKIRRSTLRIVLKD